LTTARPALHLVAQRLEHLARDPDDVGLVVDEEDPAAGLAGVGCVDLAPIRGRERRKKHPKGRTLSRRARALDRAPGSVHDPLHDGEPHPAAAARRLRAEARLEDARLHLGCDPVAGVGHGDACVATRFDPLGVSISSASTAG
jgi:hypothetical protein